jgi:hypothetical protein
MLLSGDVLRAMDKNGDAGHKELTGWVLRWISAQLELGTNCLFLSKWFLNFTKKTPIKFD